MVKRRYFRMELLQWLAKVVVGLKNCNTKLINMNIWTKLRYVVVHIAHYIQISISKFQNHIGYYYLFIKIPECLYEVICDVFK